MTPKYITKDSIFDIVFGEFCACSDETEQVLNHIIEQVRALPAADVAPVIHGKWHDVYMTSPSSFAATCSICGISNDIPHPISAHYCPHCGAKMDGESIA